jgi:hypothetical protein
MRVLKRFFENDEKIFVLYHESFLYSQCDLERVKSQGDLKDSKNEIKDNLSI